MSYCVAELGNTKVFPARCALSDANLPRNLSKPSYRSIVSEWCRDRLISDPATSLRLNIVEHGLKIKGHLRFFGGARPWRRPPAPAAVLSGTGEKSLKKGIDSFPFPCYTAFTRGCSSSVERRLPKPIRGVRFPSSAPQKKHTPKRACRVGRRQVLSGPFPSIRHRKIRKYVKYSRIFLYCLNEKLLAQNCAARKK